MVRPAGSIVCIRDQGTVVKDEDGRPAYVQGLYVDISEQKRLESELRSEAVKFKSLAEQIPAVVYIEGRVVPGQPGLHQPEVPGAVRVHPEERQARPNLWRELLHPEDRDRVLLAGSRRTTSTCSVRTIGWSRATDDSSGSTTRPCRSGTSGRAALLPGSDVRRTEQKRAEQELAQALDMERKAVERLREADDMKNTFLTAVSHDLRTPLSAILGSARALESADELDPAEDRRQRSGPRSEGEAPDRDGQRPPRHGRPHARAGAATPRAGRPGCPVGAHRSGVRRPR